MIGLDTNLLVRYIVRDDLEQAQIASAYIKKHGKTKASLFINNIVFCELVWVLETAYGYKKKQIEELLEQILHTSQFSFQNSEVVWQALAAYKKSSADFSDTLIGVSNKLNGCTKTATFDKRAAKLAEFELLTNN